MYLARPTIAVLGIGGSLAVLTSTRREGFDKQGLPGVQETTGAGGEMHAGKYRALWAWLRGQPGERMQVMFAQIEEVIGLPLPPSCGRHTAHWSSLRGKRRRPRDPGCRLGRHQRELEAGRPRARAASPVASGMPQWLVLSLS
jgi:hypothetical protein